MSSGGRRSRTSSRTNRTDCKAPCKVHDGRDQEFRHSPNHNPTCYGDQPRHKDNQCDLHCGLDTEDIQQKKDFTVQPIGLNLLEASVWILKYTSDERTLSPFNCWSWNAALSFCMFATINHHVVRCLYHRCEIILYCMMSSHFISYFIMSNHATSCFKDSYMI